MLKNAPTIIKIADNLVKMHGVQQEGMDDGQKQVAVAEKDPPYKEHVSPYKD
jgi:hypothetical protein